MNGCYTQSLLDNFRLVYKHPLAISTPAVNLEIRIGFAEEVLLVQIRSRKTESACFPLDVEQAPAKRC